LPIAGHPTRCRLLPLCAPEVVPTSPDQDDPLAPQRRHGSAFPDRTCSIQGPTAGSRSRAAISEVPNQAASIVSLRSGRGRPQTARARKHTTNCWRISPLADRTICAGSVNKPTRPRFAPAPRPPRWSRARPRRRRSRPRLRGRRATRTCHCLVGGRGGAGLAHRGRRRKPTAPRGLLEGRSGHGNALDEPLRRTRAG
jgi:hypothetical protein